MVDLLFKWMLLMIRVSVVGIAKKHKINTKGSTEADLTGDNDTMPQMLWICYFTKSQGFTINNSIIFQDKICTLLLDQNRMASRKLKPSIKGEIIFYQGRY